MFHSTPVSLLAVVLISFAVSLVVDSTSGIDDVILYGVNGLEAYVNKKGANIRVSRQLNGTGNNTDNNSTGQGFGQSGVVEVFLDSIEELDANLGKLPNGNHRTNSFANIDFVIETVYNVSLPLSVSSSVSADCLNCSATLDRVGAGAQISMAVCAINKDATLDMNGELTNVTAGQLKITFTMVNWPWDAGTNKLAVDIVIRIPPGRTVNYNSTSNSTGKPTKFSLGADSFVEFSRMVYEDGTTWKEMPSGYPMYSSNGSNNHFTLILGHFTASSVYDPNLEVGYAAVDDKDGSYSTYTSSPTTDASGPSDGCRCPAWSPLLLISLLSPLTLLLSRGGF